MSAAILAAKRGLVDLQWGRQILSWRALIAAALAALA